MRITARYACRLLLWYEPHDTMEGAIAREKQIKGGSRRKKLALIEALNRHCERSEATQHGAAAPGLLRRFAPRNDERCAE